MAEKSFSRHELFILRNDIGIDMLIKEVLHVPCENLKGRFSFLCPLCRGYNTGVNYKTNLARCFDCEKNFNTIDLVMVTRQLDFVASVRFLKKLHDSRSVNTVGHDANRAAHIGPIIDDMIKSADGAAEKTPAQNAQNISADKELSARILRLEQKTAALSLQVDKLLKAMNRLFPSP